MDELGYMPIGEAAELSGIQASTLKQWCELRRIKHARRQSDEWLVPRSELIKIPDPSRDQILNGLVYASQLGFELPVTFYANGQTLSGDLISGKAFLRHCRDVMYDDAKIATATLAGEEFVRTFKRLVDDILKGPADVDTPYEQMLDVANDPDYYDFCYLRTTASQEVLRIKIASIDAWRYGYA